jgi:hypothetical protein
MRLLCQTKIWVDVMSVHYPIIVVSYMTVCVRAYIHTSIEKLVNNLQDTPIIMIGCCLLWVHAFANECTGSLFLLNSYLSKSRSTHAVPGPSTCTGQDLLPHLYAIQTLVARLMLCFYIHTCRITLKIYELYDVRSLF